MSQSKKRGKKLPDITLIKLNRKEINMKPNHEINEILECDDFEDINATDSTQGKAGGAILESISWVYQF